MELLVFAVYDRVGGNYGDPFTANNIGVATRRFNHILGQASMIANDCDLYKIGRYDTQTGVLNGIKPEFICHFGAGDEEV